MENKKLKAAAETIIMPEEMKHRVIRNCKAKISGSERRGTMKPDMNHTFWRKPVTAAILVMIICLSVSAVAASEVLKGYFRDIKKWNGAITGTSYEQATDEIDMSVTVDGNELSVLVTFVIPQEFPYREAEKIGIDAYRIMDSNGRIVKEGTVEAADIIDGQTTVKIQLDGIDSGSYKLVVTAFVTEKKADQPLNLNGSWVCDFSR